MGRAVPGVPSGWKTRTAEERKAPWRACPFARMGMIRFARRTVPYTPSVAQYTGGRDNGDRIVLRFDPRLAIRDSNPGLAGYWPAALPAELKARLRRPDKIFPDGRGTEGTIQALAPVSFGCAARPDKTRRPETRTTAVDLNRRDSSPDRPGSRAGPVRICRPD